MSSIFFSFLVHLSVTDLSETMSYLSKFLFSPKSQDHIPLWAKVSSKTVSEVGDNNNLKSSHQSVLWWAVNEHAGVMHGASAVSAVAATAVSFPLALGDSNYPGASH